MVPLSARNSGDLDFSAIKRFRNFVWSEHPIVFAFVFVVGLFCGVGYVLSRFLLGRVDFVAQVCM